MAIGINLNDNDNYYSDIKNNSIKNFNRVRLLKDISRQINSLPLSSRSRKLLIECEKELSK